MFRIDGDRVMTTKDLLYSDVNQKDPTYDKFFGSSSFIAAAIEGVSTEGGQTRWGLNLDGAPMVVLNDELKSEFGLHPDTPTIKQMRSLGKVDIGREAMPYGKFSLVSGGAIIYYGGDILCLRRDKFAPVDPSCLTTPAGRMSEWLSIMSALELAEEIIIVVRRNSDGKLMTLGGYRDGVRQLSESDILVLKQRQIARMLEYFSDKGTNEADVLSQIRGVDDIIPIDLDQFICRNMVDERADQVFTFDKGRIKDVCSGFALYDKRNNTLEFRQVFDLTLPGFTLYCIIPGEYFQVNPTTRVVNDTQILSKDELFSGMKDGSIKAVPTLKAYFDKISESGRALSFFSRKSF